jgi:hypothetical protein
MSKYFADGVPVFPEADDPAGAEPIPVRHEEEQLTILYTRALDLLSKCSRHVPQDLKREIYRLADDTSRTTLMPIRFEWLGDIVLINPRDASG